MDNLDRMFRHLVRTIQTRHPEYLGRPFEVAELYQTILPYRLHRRELGLDTNQDYEMTMLELLSGARGYLVVDDRMRDALRKELGSGNPDPSVLREFAAAHVALASDAVRRLDTPEGRDGVRAEPMPAAPAPASRHTRPRPSSEDTPAVATPTSAPAPTASTIAAPRRGSSGHARVVTIAATGEPCRFCGGALPPGRQITFCPHCGQNLTVINCAACGTELELGWTYCTTCGRAVAPPE
ncbi:MAG: zinc ribbon domain-containing protein [Gemmatimonadaceae bacterium]